ncbi:MAG: phenylalanine--tRNA ligase subunit beta, partial [Bdellovibrionales bacterium]|nr:phenylalanine--tRNA ligase subunit beta [Bdellovibrionales bacterium]
IRGVESFGMICASEEIGLSHIFPAQDKKEIVDLVDAEVEAGMSLADYLGFNDIVLDIDNKSLTNRPDLWGHYGIARELAAIYKCPLQPLPTFAFEDMATKGDIEVVIEDPERCHRFTALRIDGVQNGPAPRWMRNRLAKVGQRPISLLVDITNYVMFAMGKPTHAFDTTQIANGKLCVRRAKNQEILKLLDGTELALDEEVLIVADDAKPLGLAGIMGGLGSGVTAETTSIVFESANFEPVQVRRTAKRFDLRTESSMRFEKGLDTESTLHSQAYLVHLLSEIQPNIEVVQYQDQFPTKPTPVRLSVSEPFIVDRIGMKISAQEIENYLRSLGYGVVYRSAHFDITVPPWRATGDVSLPEDIVEEVARLIGYDNLKFEPIPVALSKAVRQPWYELDQSIRAHFSKAVGLQEVVSYPWVHETFIYACQEEEAPAYQLAAAPSPEQAKLKTCLAPSLLEFVERNTRFYDDFGLFEISRVFKPGKTWERSGKGEALPDQPKLLGATLVGKDAQSVFLRLKGGIESLFKQQLLPLSCVEAKEAPGWTMSNGVVELWSGDSMLGHLGLVSKRTLRRAKIERVNVAMLVCNLDLVYRLEKTAKRFQPIPKFPEIEYDLAVVFDRQTPWSSIAHTVLRSHELIRDIHFVDEYTGKQIPEDKKSVAFKMVLADQNATLTSEQAADAASKVLSNLAAELQGALRS